MGRYKLPSCVFTDQSGNIVEDGTCSVYLAGTDTVASIYAASSGGSAVNSVVSDSAGQCTWYVDTADYATSQKFKITFSKTNFTSKTYDDIAIFHELNHILTPATLDNNASGTPSVSGEAFLESNGTTTVTNFTNGTNGQFFMLLATTTFTITHNTLLINCHNASDQDLEAGDVVSFIKGSDGIWYQVGPR